MPDRDVARQFQLFSAAIRDEAPLYTRIAEAIIGDDDLLSLAGQTLPGQPSPNVLFAAVHYLLLEGASHPLRAWYADDPPDGDPFEDFRAFCQQYRIELVELIGSRRTQTNEVARCLALLPAFTLVTRRAPSRELGLIEIGASGGLLMNFDRYRYDFGSQATWGDRRSPVRLRTELVGDVPPLPQGKVPVHSRVGIDLHPLDVTSDVDGRWLQALQWPGQAGRRARLQSALRIARKHPPHVIEGDALDLLGAEIERLPDEVVPLVYHSFALIQWTPEQHARLDDLLASVDRPVMRVWLEWFRVDRDLPELRLIEYGDDHVHSLTVARFHHHGRWLDWGSPPG